ncbi:MAG TPA: right-handed parallel beta-helix repeat-containing protein [Anaerovoracaceae bacterium]|nr:right-handed parallel beta-helix repeat-containing protein [Anaerovoracaceae bacterium]
MGQKSLPNSVRYFGAKGDSITDDTKAIQKAVDSGIGQIVFPTGVYRITRTIEIVLDQSGPMSLSGSGTATIIMNGAGPAFKFIGTHAGSADPSSVKNNVWKNQRMPLVDGLEIVGKHPDAVGIEATGTMDLTLTRILVRETLHGIHLYNRNRNVIISECHIYHNRGIGIYLDEVNLHQINITNSHISYNGGGGIVVRHGDVHNLQIGSCDIECNMDKNGPPTANVFLDISEGAMMEGAIVGCTIQHDVNIPGSSNIRFIGHGPEKPTEVGNMTIADNNLSETQDNVHIKYGRGIIVTGNTFYMGLSHNILVENSEHILLANNIMDRNPHYGQKTMETRDRIVIRDSRNLSINGLQLYNTKGDEAGIVLERCQNYNLTNSTILNCNEAGISLIDSEKGNVSGNFINDERPEVKNPISIRIQGGKSNLIVNNYTSGVIDGKPDNATIINNHSY